MSKGKKKKSGNGAGAVAFGVTFVLLSSIFKIHGLFSLAVQLAVSAFVSAVIRTMAQGLDLTTDDQKKKMAEEAAAEAAKEEEKRKNDALKRLKANTGNPDVDQLLTQGREMIAEIRKENDLIPDESLSAKLDDLEENCAAIFQAVYENPARAPQIRKFMDYYLPTTLKMVKSYRKLDERNLPMAEAKEAQHRIDDALGVVITGCQKMLKNLYKDDMLDIATDIDVLEQMLKRDGLTESELEKAAEQAKQAARLDAALPDGQNSAVSSGQRRRRRPGKARRPFTRIIACSRPSAAQRNRHGSICLRLLRCPAGSTPCMTVRPRHRPKKKNESHQTGDRAIEGGIFP